MTSSPHTTNSHPIDISLRVDRLRGLSAALAMLCRHDEEMDGELRAAVEVIAYYLNDEVENIWGEIGQGLRSLRVA